MKALFSAVLSFAVLGFAAAGAGCAVQCIEDSTGTRCTAKSLKRFEGPAQQAQQLERAPGAGVTIDVLYGNVIVQRSGSGKLEAQFAPFAYAGHDEQAYAEQQLAQNLRTSATAAGGVVVSVRREGGTNGLGADAIVRLPDDFDGPLTIINHGGGPVNDFDVRVEFVGRASAIAVTNHSMLGSCHIQGAPSIRSTTVQCGEDISVFDVSDEVNITNTEKRHDAGNPAVTLRVASVSPGSRGGRIQTASGAIQASFPRAGGYVLSARSPVKGLVTEGGLPQGCANQAASPGAKTITCGQGPVYELLAGASPDYIGQPRDNNVLLAYH
jgi:hypothetical protein